MADLTTRVNVKRAIGVPSAVTQHDDFIDILLDVADEEVLGYTGQTAMTATTVTGEKYDIATNHETELVLRNFPVSAVAAVVVNGSTLSTNSWYIANNEGVIRLKSSGAFFPEGSQVVSVDYTYGFAVLPNDLKFAATLICVAHFNRARHSGLSSEGVGSYRYNIDRYSIPQSAQSILARYRAAFPRGSR